MEAVLPGSPECGSNTARGGGGDLQWMHPIPTHLIGSNRATHSLIYLGLACTEFLCIQRTLSTQDNHANISLH